jgi:hypothetical protein
MSKRKTMTKKIFKQSVAIFFLVLLVFFCLISGWIVFPFVRDVMVHDQVLRNLETSLHQVKHPANTTFVRDFKSIGVLSGNGDHCDYVAGELRSYSGDEHAIKNFYTHDEIYIIFLENGKIPENNDSLLPSYTLKNLLYGENPPTDLQSKMYLVMLTNMFNDPGLDFRCS